MPDASGTPSTNYLIPKYNTAVDPPSGKGFNTAIDFIDNLLKTGFTEKPSGIASGEVPVWNGSAWVRSSATKLAATGTGVTPAYSSGQNWSASNIDIAWTAGDAAYILMNPSITGGSLRSLGAGSYPGQVATIRNGSSGVLSILHNTAGGSGQVFFLRGAVSSDLYPNETMTFLYTGALWVEVASDLRQDLVQAQFITANSGSLAGTEAAPSTIITHNNITFSGLTTVLLEATFPWVAFSTPTAGDIIGVSLWEGTTTDLGRIWEHEVLSAAVADLHPVVLRAYITPAAGAHQYTFRAWRTAGSTTLHTWLAGAGGVATTRHAMYRVARAMP